MAGGSWHSVLYNKDLLLMGRVNTINGADLFFSLHRPHSLYRYACFIIVG